MPKLFIIIDLDERREEYSNSETLYVTIHNNYKAIEKLTIALAEGAVRTSALFVFN